MIIAANEGEEITEHMEAKFPAVCRDCGAKLMADTFTVRVAIFRAMQLRRRVKFFCLACTANYDQTTITEHHDHRR